MRLLRGSLPLFMALLAGCQYQPASLTNPFLAPDRVPPPSTRTLQPGTAQPYYPGDPLPGAPATGTTAPAYTPPPNSGNPSYGAPAASPTGQWPTAPSTAPQQTPYTPASGYGVTPTSAEIPLGPQNESYAAEAVRVPDDEQRLRFARAGHPGSESSSVPTITRDDSILPTPQFATAPPAQQPISQQPASHVAADNFVSSQQNFQPAQLRAVAPAEYHAPLAQNYAQSQSPWDGAPQLFGRDGFRPQGSTERFGEPPSHSYADQPFGTPGTTSSGPWQSPSVASGTAQSAKFGMGPTYEWLRGQLAYSPETQQWRVVYMPEGSQPDQLGGSVAVANPQLLANLQAGDFVMVRGQLYNLQNEQNAFMPVYQLAGVQRQQQ